MKALLMTVVLFLSTGLAHSEINIVDSLEWMAMDSPLIVRGKVVGLQETKGPGTVIYRDVVIEVEEWLKGKFQGKNLTIRLRGYTTYDAEALKANGHSCLFFLARGKAEDRKPLEGWWVPRDHWQSIVDLEEPKRVYTGDMTRPKNAEEILKITKEYAAREKPGPGVGSPNIFKPQGGYLRLPIAPDAEFFREVFCGSACYLNVPAEEKYRPIAMKLAKSHDIKERRRGADMLRNYPGPETVKLLTALLADPYESRWARGPDELVKIVYPARLAAYDALIALGEKPEKPVVERQPTKEEIRSHRDDHWKSAVGEVLPEGWRVISIKTAKEPIFWTRSAGGDGIAIEARNPKVTLQSPLTGPYHPSFTLFVMPMEWEGEDRRNGGKVDERKFVRTRGSVMIDQTYKADYLGHNGTRHFFCALPQSAGDFDPHKAVTRYFALKIEQGTEQ